MSLVTCPPSPPGGFGAADAGRTIVIQWVQSGRSTSLSVNHCWDVISTSVAVTPSAGSSRTTFQVKLESGAATYRSSAVSPDCARAVAGCGAGTARGSAVASVAKKATITRRRREEVRGAKRKGASFMRAE